MKKSVFLAIVGAAALTGCQTEVMQQRGYVPASQDDAAAMRQQQAQVRDVSQQQQDEQQLQARRQQAQTRGASEFPAMTATFSNDGIDSESAGAAGAAAAGEYVVKSGDTLGKIAAKHHVRLSALMKANNLTEKDAKKLRVGKKLVIPARDGKAAKSGRKGGKAFGAKNDKNGGKNGSKGGKASIQPGEYIVKSGDTPEKIARRAKVKLSALMDANNLTEKDARSLRIGQKLVIPARDGKAAAKPATKKAAKKAEQPAKSGKSGKSEGLDDLEREMNKEADGKPAAAPSAAPAAAPAADAAPAGNGDWELVSSPAPIDDFAKKHNTTPEALRRENSDLVGKDTIPANTVVILPKK